MKHQIAQIEHVARVLRDLRILGGAQITAEGEIKGTARFSHDPAALATTLREAVKELHVFVSAKKEGIDDLPALVSKAQAARALGISPRTLSRWISLGSIAVIKTSPTKQGQVLIRRSELNRFLSQHERRRRGG